MVVTLLHLCDSLFPTGGFAHSDGLETATVSGAVSTPGDLERWLEACTADTIERLEGPAAFVAWQACRDRAWDSLARIDQEAIAMRPSASTRRATKSMGLRLVTTWSALHPDERLEEMLRLARAGQLAPALPVAFGAVCGAAGIDGRTTISAFAYTRLSAVVSAALRLMRLGQTDAHRALARALVRVPAAVDRILAGDGAARSFAPALDIAAMRQQYLHSRLFLS